ncbi:MAG: DNA repair protein RecN [Ardenticatenaceae bacterium]|nr:DNA repair protein RecN [Ardenticatenaceae bacterium]MCB8947764.1 DNA repair protein RecN [Ardenticatenaceae bacterium]
MLTELYIRNFAIIDELRLKFHDGFNVLTGETGAGKSIILDAVTLMLGGRADTTFVRAGAGEAYVEATFTLSEALKKVVEPILEAEGLDEEHGDEVLLSRELRLNGRNICRVNGRTVNLSVLRDVAEPLIDIHGQGEHLSLLHPRSHLPLLDSYAGVQTERAVLGVEIAALMEVQHELADLRQNERILAQRADMLRFQIEEITAARLEEDEEEELRAERTRLANSEQLMRSASEAVNLLTGMDDESQAVADMLGQVERSLVQLTRYDETQGPLLERLQGLIYQLSEVSSELQSYLDEVEYNPKRLDFVEERLELINLLKRKYGEDIPTILALRDRAKQDLSRIENSEVRTAELVEAEEKYLRRCGEMALALSKKRQAAAEKLATAVVEQLADLQMDGAKFEVQFERTPQADGLYVEGERLAFDKTGFDTAEFLISTNPGEPLKPMVKVASGGETARLMLALKTALAQVDKTPTLIFDEIDQGIGGRVGDVVGRKLWGLTAIAHHQVIVVTHLPQLAGYGDVHFHVSKAQADGGRTTTRIQSLDGDGRIQELAAMLGTQGEHARGGAESILALANGTKTAVKAK